MIFWFEIVFLSSLIQKNQRQWWNSIKQPLEFDLQLIMGDTLDCPEKASRIRALGLTDPWCYFLFLIIIRNKLENVFFFHYIRKHNKMWSVAQNLSHNLPTAGRNLWPLGHRTCNKNVSTRSHRPGWFFLTFSPQLLLFYRCFSTSLKEKQK